MKKQIKKVEKKTQISHKELYTQSFKWNKSFVMTLLLDFGYFITFLIMLFCFFFILQTVLTPAAFAMQSIVGLFSTMSSSGEMNTIAEQTLQQNFLTLQWFYIKGFILIICAISFLFIMTSLYKAGIWLHISEQKHTGKYLWKFLRTSFLWQLIWLIVAIIIFFVFTAQFATFFLLLELFLYLYFTPFVRLLFTEKHTILNIYKEAFITGFKKFKHFIIPFTLMTITVIFSLWIFLFIAELIPLLLILIGPILIFLAITWVRFYFVVVAKKVFHNQTH
ncbi:MAG: hypothetical protein WC254_00995 [Candidatus Woesearchaeota archaeon]